MVILGWCTDNSNESLPPEWWPGRFESAGGCAEGEERGFWNFLHCDCWWCPYVDGLHSQYFHPGILRDSSENWFGGKSIWKLFSHSFRQIPSTFDDLMLQDIQIGHHAWRRRWSGNLLWGLGGWAWDAGNFTGFFFRPAGTRRLAGCGWRTMIIIYARIYI